MPAKMKEMMTCGTQTNRRIKRIHLDRFHIAYTRRIITPTIESMVSVNEIRETVTHNRRQEGRSEIPSKSPDIAQYLWDIRASDR